MKFLQILFLILGVSVAAYAQNTEKIFILSGTVFDPVAALVPATKVIAENKDGRKFQTSSDENGVYKLSIPFGKYTITFQANGFITAEFVDFENLSSLEKTLDVNLEVGACNDCGEWFSGDDDNQSKIENDNLSENRKLEKTYLSGIIIDQVGAVIPKAKIKAVGNKKTFTAESDGNGLYKIDLPEGVYTIEFGASGHKSYKIKEYRKIYQSMSLDVALYVAPTPII